MGKVAMVFPKARLMVSAGLFLAWISFLVYLVLRTRDPVILSRPQLIVASLVVVAEVRDKNGRPDPTVTVKKVAWSLAGDEAGFADKQLVIAGLADCGPKQGWAEAGDYIVPLTKRGQNYEVTPLPLSPGYESAYVTMELARVGPEKDKVAALVSRLRGGGDANAEPKAGILRRDVPRNEAFDFKKKFEDAGASVRLMEGETRIYRAVGDALEQLQEVRPKTSLGNAVSTGRRD